MTKEEGCVHGSPGGGRIHQQEDQANRSQCNINHLGKVGIPFAGNEKAETLAFQVNPALITLTRMLDRYGASGDMGGPLEPQLRNSLKQAQHQYDKGSMKQAVDFLG